MLQIASYKKDSNLFQYSNYEFDLTKVHWHSKKSTFIGMLNTLTFKPLWWPYAVGGVIKLSVYQSIDIQRNHAKRFAQAEIQYTSITNFWLRLNQPPLMVKEANVYEHVQYFDIQNQRNHAKRFDQRANRTRWRMEGVPSGWWMKRKPLALQWGIVPHTARGVYSLRLTGIREKRTRGAVWHLAPWSVFGSQCQ